MSSRPPDILAIAPRHGHLPPNAMGEDHPITWCKLYDGDNVNDGTGNPKPHDDGRTWITGMGHFGSSYSQHGNDKRLVKQIVGGVRWIAGDGRKSDCSV